MPRMQGSFNIKKINKIYHLNRTKEILKNDRSLSRIDISKVEIVEVMEIVDRESIECQKERDLTVEFWKIAINTF